MALYRPIRNTTDYLILQSDISAVSFWINSNYLSLQPAKCCAMFISRKRCHSVQPPTLMVDECPLTLVSSVKYLGIQINSDLSWSPHVANLCTKTRKLIGLLYRRFYKSADTKTLLQLYKSFIRPHLEYCSIVWDPYLTKDVETLEKVQRFGLRVCLKNWTMSHDQLLQQANVSSLSVRRAHSKLCHIFKIMNDLTDFPDAPLQSRELHYSSRQSNAL